MIGNNEVALAALALMGLMVRYLIKDLRAHTKASIELKTYLVERNGRDNEQHKENIKVQRNLTKAVKALPVTMQSIADTAVTQIISQDVAVQHVTKQEVDKQRVKSKE